MEIKKGKTGTGADQAFHCIAACKAKKAGNSPDLIRGMLNQKENSDYVRGRLGLYGDRKFKSHDEMVQDNNADKAVNEAGLSCAANKTCEEQCEPFISTIAPLSQNRMREYVKTPEYKRY